MLQRRLIALAGAALRSVFQNVLFQWLSLLCNIALIICVCLFIEAFLGGASLDTALPPLTLAIIGACIIFRFACAIGSTKAGFTAASSIKLTLRRLLYTKALALGPAFRAKAGTAELLQVATEGVEQLESYFARYLPQLLYSILAPLTLFAALVPLDLPCALVLLALTPFIPLCIILIQRTARKRTRKHWNSYTNLGTRFLENIQGLTTLKIYEADAAKHEQMNAEAEGFRRTTMQLLTMQLSSITLMDILAFGGAAAGAIVAVLGFVDGRISLASVLAIILLASEFFIPLRMLGSFFHVAMTGVAASEAMFRVLDLPEDADGFIDEAPAPRQLLFEDVGYSYDGARWVLQGLDLRIERGLTALVGESGCGKSTVAALLAGHLPDHEGRITLDGRPLGDHSRRCLSRMMTYVGHDAFLFTGTVRENLLMACDDGPPHGESPTSAKPLTSGKPSTSTDARLWEALEQVDLAAWLKTQNGLETRLEERAANFSGGQRQRLALARALLHDSPVYLFDEAASNIDVESEARINEVIKALAKKKTVLLISHRLANVVEADTIYVLKSGRLVQQGSHAALISEGGHYASLFEAQSRLEHIARKGA